MVEHKADISNLKDIEGARIISIGEFDISQCGDTLLIVKDGESMQVNLDTLRRFWDENF
jgi:hypothetical protein